MICEPHCEAGRRKQERWSEAKISSWRMQDVLKVCLFIVQITDHFSSWSGLVTGFMKLFSNVYEILGGVAPPYFVARYVHSLQYE
jgi:hypothetical protein